MTRLTLRFCLPAVLFFASMAACVDINRAAAAEDLFPAPQEKSLRQSAMGSDRCIFDQKHFWVRGGQITVNPRTDDVFGVARFFSPPFATYLYELNVSLAGEPVALDRYEWRPGEVWRSGKYDELRIETLLTPAVDRRGFLLTARVKNEGTHAVTVPLRVTSKGNMEQTQVWGFNPPKPKEPLVAAEAPTRLAAEPRSASSSRLQNKASTAAILLTNRHGTVVVVADLSGLAITEKGSALSGDLKVSPGQTVEFHIALAVGAIDEAIAAADAILAKPAEQIAAARRYWAERIEKVYTRLPRVISDNRRLVEFYDRALLSIPLAQWEMPGFILSPHNATSSIDGGSFCCYFWDNLGYRARINPICDPEVTRSHLLYCLKSKPLEHYAFNALDGTPLGPLYAYNQYSIVRGIYHYVTMTGDTAFLDEKVDGKTVLEHVITHATHRDDLTKPVRLIDYGDNSNLLELKLTKAYEGHVPSPNAERCWSYRAADQLAALAGKPSPNLSKRAEALASLLVKELWSDSLGWFQTRGKNGKLHVCYSVQIFDLLRLDILDAAKQAAILQHLNDKEFLSKYGLHSLSKQDPGYDPNDVDWGGPGVYTADAPELVCDLYHSGHPEKAGDLLRRILWWGETMPYYPQAIHADRIDYRRNGRANLQAGSTVAEALIFGTLGLNVTPDGTVSVRPYLPLDTKSLEFKGVRVRNLTFDIAITPDGFEIVTSAGQKLSGKLGQKTTVFATSDPK